MSRVENKREEQGNWIGGSSIWPGLVSVITLQAWHLTLPTAGPNHTNTHTALNVHNH